MEQSIRTAKAMEAAGRWAAKKFRYDPDCEAKVLDAMDVAWEFAKHAPPVATPGSIARFAVQRVGANRQFKESARSITGPNPERAIKPWRVTIDLRTIGSRRNDNPAEIACFRLTFIPWLESLSRKMRKLALAFIDGESTTRVAQRFKLSAARVSQIRRELRESWEAFTA